MLQIGQIFDTKYEIKQIIGRGGMGSVYLAEHIKLGTLWAIKEVNKKGADKVDLLAEPNMLKKLNHPSLPRIIDIDEDGQYIYLVMDYIEGTSLDKELKNKKKFEEKQVIEWLKQICDALKYLHSMKPNPIIYRDLKPSNLIISSDGSIKIIDFGIAKEHRTDTAETSCLGTRGYAAPEQYSGESKTDVRTDIYNLGMTIFHILTGRNPNEFANGLKPLCEIDSSLSVGIEHIVEKCTQQNPAKRYQSVDALLKDVQNIKKFDAEYKKRLIKQSTVVILTITSLILFINLTINGWHQLQTNKGAIFTKGFVMFWGGISGIAITLIMLIAIIIVLFKNNKTIESTDTEVFPTNQIVETEILGFENESSNKYRSNYNDDINDEVRTVKLAQFGFNRIVLCIWGNSEFGCELAFITAKLSKKTVLLLDFDIQKPCASVYLDISAYSDYSTKNSSGMEVLISLLDDGQILTEDAFKKVSNCRTDIDNLYIITGDPFLKNEMLFPSDEKLEKIKKITQMANKSFDIVITLCNESMLDPYTVCMLETADYSIVARHQDVDEINAFYNQLNYLKENKNIKLHNVNFLAYEYSDNCIEDTVVTHKDLFNLKEHYIGHISYCDKRVICKNKKSIYAKHMSDVNSVEYKKLLGLFNIVIAEKRSLNPIQLLERLLN